VATVCITGAAGGIGRATRRLLEARGDTVVGVDLRGAEVDADLATDEGRAAMVAGVTERSGGVLDGLVVGAGVQGAAPPLVVSVNFFGAIATLEGLRPLLAAGTDASVVAISSNSATAMQGIAPAVVDACLAGDEAAARAAAEAAGPYVDYPSTKLALARWVRRRAPGADWIGAGIRLNAVAPGPTATAMTDGLDMPVLELGERRRAGGGDRLPPVPGGVVRRGCGPPGRRRRRRRHPGRRLADPPPLSVRFPQLFRGS
jgi:NAD(P)-dependent dehydrogenase (short-subunit alcohol dehydrogenase family)